MQARPGSGRPESFNRPEISNRQESGKSDRSRRDAVTAAPEAGRSGAAPQTGRITKEPDASTRPVERRAPTRRVVKDEQWAQYDIILTRNMFSRQRIRPDLVNREPERKVMPNPESYFLLKGVTEHGNQFIAFVEDKNSGAVLRLRQGDRVARGTVKSLTLDVLEYQFQDKTITVNLGYDLEGGRGAITAGDLANFSPAAAPAASTPAGSTATPAAPAADEAAILKRLMEQRQQQMGR